MSDLLLIEANTRLVQSRAEIQELRRLLRLTEPYLCEMPAEVDAEIREYIKRFPKEAA